MHRGGTDRDHGSPPAWRALGLALALGAVTFGVSVGCSVCRHSGDDECGGLRPRDGGARDASTDRYVARPVVPDAGNDGGTKDAGSGS